MTKAWLAAQAPRRCNRWRWYPPLAASMQAPLTLLRRVEARATRSPGDLVRLGESGRANTSRLNSSMRDCGSWSNIAVLRRSSATACDQHTLRSVSLARLAVVFRMSAHLLAPYQTIRCAAEIRPPRR